MKLHSNVSAAVGFIVIIGTMVGASLEVGGQYGARKKAYDAFESRTFSYHPLMQAGGTPGDSIAIPGVFGYGANAFNDAGCFQDTVIVEKVTVLLGDTSTAGTLVNTLLHKQHGDTLTVITFDTGGWMSESPAFEWGGYKGELNCVYIAAHTAPGGGFGMSRYRNWDIRDDSKGFVMRGMTVTGEGSENDAAPTSQVSDATYWIWMEMTHLWSHEKQLLISAANPTTPDTILYGTVFRSIFAQGNTTGGGGGDPTAMQIGKTLVNDQNAYLTLARNLWQDHSHRNPLISDKNANTTPSGEDQTPRVRMLGNTAYNVANQGVVHIRSRMVDVIDFFFKPGAMSQPQYDWVVSIDVGSTGDSAHSVYVENLYGEHNQDTTRASADLWWDGTSDTTFAEVSCYYRQCRLAGGGDPFDFPAPMDGSLPSWIQRDTAITDATFEFPRIDVLVLRDSIFGTATDSGAVGAYQHLQCDGTFIARPDSMLRNLLKEARNDLGGSYGTVNEAYIDARYRYTKSAGTPCTDSDGDGLPNAFEVRIQGGTDSTGAVINADSDGDGFVNVMEYVNGTNPTSFTYSDGSEGGGDPPTAPTDSLLLFPGAKGWGAEGWSCQDSLRAGTGNAAVKVWRVTSKSSSGSGTLESALDSAYANAHSAVCNYILLLPGGNYSAPELRYTDAENIRISGQTARGGGAYIYGTVEFREGDGILAEYIAGRKVSNGQTAFYFNCSQNYYQRHSSISWINGTGGQNMLATSCGSVSVPLSENTADFTYDMNLIGEPFWTHPTLVHMGGLDSTRQARGLITRTFGQGPGHRAPLMSDGDTLGAYHNIWYNTFDRASQLGSGAFNLDIFHNRYKVGPAWKDTDEKRWPIVTLDVDTTVLRFRIGGIAWTQNSYDDTAPIDSLLYGSYPGPKVAACDADDQIWCAVHGDSFPPSMIRADTLPTSRSAVAEIDLSASLDSTMIEFIFEHAGNSKGLTCAGGWALSIDGVSRRDSVDDRFIQQYRDGTGENTTLNINATTRPGIPEAATGTLCTDTDSDGLPDEYELAEQGTATGLAVDSMVLGRPAIEWYLAGRGLDGAFVALEDETAGSGGGGSSYQWSASYQNASGKRVFVRRVPLVYGPPYYGATESVKLVSPRESLPQGAVGNLLPDSNSPATTSRGFFFTCDSVESGATVMDSSEFVDSAVVVTGVPSSTLIPRNPTGCP